MPRVKTYTYFGVSLCVNLCWKGHIDHLLARGERNMAACLFGTKSADLPLSFVQRIYQTYVHSSVILSALDWNLFLQARRWHVFKLASFSGVGIFSVGHVVHRTSLFKASLGLA